MDTALSSTFAIYESPKLDPNGNSPFSVGVGKGTRILVLISETLYQLYLQLWSGRRCTKDLSSPINYHLGRVLLQVFWFPFPGKCFK